VVAIGWRLRNNNRLMLMLQDYGIRSVMCYDHGYVAGRPVKTMGS